MKIKTGDSVVVISGKDKGKTGSVLRVLPNKNRLVVAGINMRTKHIKATPQSAGQKITYEASLHYSNVMVVDPKTKKRSRIGYREDQGSKIRFAKNSGEAIKRTALKVTEEDSTKAAAKEAPKKKSAKETAAFGPEGSGPEWEAAADKAVEATQEKATKTPFWKKMGFGASAQAEVEQDTSDSSGQDSTPPETNKVPDIRSHQRGN